MRISIFEKEAILSTVVAKDPAAKVWLFGSRADDSKKGGDIDIGILSEKIDFAEKLGIKTALFEKIGEQKIDLIISKTGEDVFFKCAVKEGILLND
jgi:predicted nucleotidyltransferase